MDDVGPRTPRVSIAPQTDGTIASDPLEMVRTLTSHFAQLERAALGPAELLAARHASTKPTPYNLLAKNMPNDMPTRCLARALAQ